MVGTQRTERLEREQREQARQERHAARALKAAAQEAAALGITVDDHDGDEDDEHPPPPTEQDNGQLDSIVDLDYDEDDISAATPSRTAESNDGSSGGEINSGHLTDLLLEVRPSCYMQLLYI